MTTKFNSLAGFAIVTALCIALVTPAFAQTNQEPVRADHQSSQVATQVAQEVYSPFCPGKTLAMCTSSAAADARRDIQEMAASGMSKDAIKDKLIAEYGEEFRMVEPPSGDNFGLLAALGAGFLVAGFAVWLMVGGRRREKKPGSAKEQPSGDGSKGRGDADGSDPYLDQLRREYRD